MVGLGMEYHGINLDVLGQFISMVHSRVPPNLVGPFMERLNDTNCPIAFETIPHIQAMCSKDFTLLTAENSEGVFVRAIPNDFVGVVRW